MGDALGWLFVAAMGVTLFEVAARCVFNAPTSWGHSLATTLCGVAFALGGAHAMARDEHVRIGAVYERVGPGTRRAVDLLSYALGAFYLGGFAVGLYGQAKDAVWKFDWNGVWTPELTPGPPNWPLPAILRVALLIGAILFLAVLIQVAVARLRRADPAPVAPGTASSDLI